MLLALAGCVVAVQETIQIDQPVARIEVDVSVGDVNVKARPGPVRLIGTFGGAGRGPIDYLVVDEVLTVSFHCSVCAGELTIEAPPSTELLLAVSAGDLSVEGFDAFVNASVTAGQAGVRDHGGGPVALDLDVGDADVDFTLVPERFTASVATGTVRADLPGGSYALTLQAPRGSVRTTGPIIDDPMSPNVVDISVRTGSIRLSGH